MTAQECYDNVMKSRLEKAEETRTKLYAYILESVKNGDLYCSFSGHISKELKSELEQAGFDVSMGSQYNESYTNISWDLKR